MNPILLVLIGFLLIFIGFIANKKMELMFICIGLGIITIILSLFMENPVKTEKNYSALQTQSMKITDKLSPQAQVVQKYLNHQPIKLNDAWWRPVNALNDSIIIQVASELGMDPKEINQAIYDGNNTFIHWFPDKAVKKEKTNE